MTIETRYRADEPADGSRYVRYDGAGQYFWCETGHVTRAGWRNDIAQGTCAVDDLPPDVAMKAIAAHGSFPSYVDWPLVEEEPDAYGRTGERYDCGTCGSTGTGYGETCVTCGGYGWVKADV